MKAFVIALALGAASPAAAQPVSTGEWELTADQIVAALIENSRNKTELTSTTLVDGSIIRQRQLPPVNTPLLYEAPEHWPAPRPALPGSIVDSQPLPPPQEESLCVQPLDDGRVLLGRRASVSLYRAPGAPPETVLPFGARQLVPNADGSRILVVTAAPLRGSKTCPDLVVLSADTLTSVTSRATIPPGAHAYWGSTPDSLLLTEELVNMSGSEKTRVFVRAYDLANIAAPETLVPWSTLPFAAIGRIAPADLTWGHARVDYQIDPVPAPLERLREGIAADVLTAPAREADTAPAAGREGPLYFLRTMRRGGPSGRLLAVEHRGATRTERPLTAWPTHALGVSAGGSRIAFTATGADGAHRLHLATREELAALDSTATGAADAALRANWSQTVRALEAALLDLEIGRTMEASEFGPQPKRAPTTREIEALRDVLTSALREEFKLPELRGLQRLAQLDYLLDEADGILLERPATVIALGGIFVQAAKEEGIGHLLLEGATPYLTADFDNVAASDNMTGTLAAPFAIARERIGANLSMASTLAELRDRWKQPVLFVENFDDSTRAAIGAYALRAADLTPEQITIPNLAAALQRWPDNDTVALLLYHVAREERDATHQFVASSILARNNPSNAEAFLFLARALAAMGETRAALAAAEWAAQIAPDDPRMLLAHADALFDERQFLEAARIYRAVPEKPGGQFYLGDVTSRLEAILEFSKYREGS